MDIRVAIFDDNPLIRENLSAIINGTSGYNCTGTYADAMELSLKLKQCLPHIVLMDIDMPLKNGIEATKEIKQLYPDMNIIIQTVFDDDDKIFKAILAGATGYLLKNTPPSKILESIKECYDGGSPMTPVIARRALSFFSNNTTQKQPDSDYEKLSERQLEILELIKNGYSYKRIAEEKYITVQTVKYHVMKIYDILHIENRAELFTK
jgi:DNA-binding NarL/FixJ family response regulator